jgi:hypothetical protein
MWMKAAGQALEWAAPVLPLRPGIPESAAHDYIRHGPVRRSMR